MNHLALLQSITVGWRDLIEILILTALVYNGYRYFRTSRGSRILTGLLILLLALTLLSRFLELEVINWIITNFFVFLAIALVIIFQPELRHALASLGSHRFFSFREEKQELVSELSDIVQRLSAKRYGALIALKRSINLDEYLTTGVPIGADISPELFLTIFHPKTALHDGGIIIQNDRLEAAACVFPVSQRDLLDRSVGLRHRAGLGISEESDAIALIVSEETGHISIAHSGNLETDLELPAFQKRLSELLQLEATHNDENEPHKDPTIAS